MAGFEKQKITQNLVNPNDHSKELSVQMKIFSQRMLDDIMKNDPPYLNYCLRLKCSGQIAFTQFIHVLY